MYNFRYFIYKFDILNCCYLYCYLRILLLLRYFRIVILLSNYQSLYSLSFNININLLEYIMMHYSIEIESVRLLLFHWLSRSRY